MKREERKCAEWEEHEKIEAARVAAEKEEARKARRAAKRAEKQKAVEVVGEAEVVVVDGPSEEVRPQKRAKTTEVSMGPNGEPEMEAAEVACRR